MSSEVNTQANAHAKPSSAKDARRTRTIQGLQGIQSQLSLKSKAFASHRHRGEPAQVEPLPPLVPDQVNPAAAMVPILYFKDSLVLSREWGKLWGLPLGIM